MQYIKAGFLVLTIIILACCRSVPKNTSYNTQSFCSKFREGRYSLTFNSELTPGNPTIVKRTALTQIEYHQNDSSIYHVEWLDDCRYLLKDEQPETTIIEIFEEDSSGYHFSIKLYNSDEDFTLVGYAEKLSK